MHLVCTLLILLRKNTHGKLAEKIRKNRRNMFVVRCILRSRSRFSLPTQCFEQLFYLQIEKIRVESILRGINLNKYKGPLRGVRSP